MLEIPQGYFKNHYDLRGSDWLRSVSAEERQAFAYIAVRLPYADLETVADFAEELDLEFCPICGEVMEVETRFSDDSAGECPVRYGRTVAYVEGGEEHSDSPLTPGGGA